MRGLFPWVPFPAAAAALAAAGLLMSLASEADSNSAEGFTVEPTPTSRPTQPSRVDVNCDGQITPADAQIILRYVAQLPYTIPSGCPTIGTMLFPVSTGTPLPTITGTPPRESPRLPIRQGDADCLHGVSAIDALIVLRFIAHLPYSLLGGCPPLE